MEYPIVLSLDLVTSRWHSSVEQSPRVPCSDLKDDGDTCSDVVRSRCSPAHLGVSEVPWVDGEYSFVSETAVGFSASAQGTRGHSLSGQATLGKPMSAKQSVGTLPPTPGPLGSTQITRI